MFVGNEEFTKSKGSSHSPISPSDAIDDQPYIDGMKRQVHTMKINDRSAKTLLLTSFNDAFTVHLQLFIVFQMNTVMRGSHRILVNRRFSKPCKDVSHIVAATMFGDII